MIYIKFGGTVDDKRVIRLIEEEFIDIAEISGWKYELVSENFRTLTNRANKELFLAGAEKEDAEGFYPLNSSDVFLEGISLALAPNMDPLRFVFDKAQKLSTISFSSAEANSPNSKFAVKKYEFLYYPYIKLVTNNHENHTKAVKILEYVKKKYIRDLEVIDTSFYWENRDEEALKVRFWKQRKDREMTV